MEINIQLDFAILRFLIIMDWQYFLTLKRKMEDDYQFDDLDLTGSVTPGTTGATGGGMPAAATTGTTASTGGSTSGITSGLTGAGHSDHGYGARSEGGKGGDSYATELFSKQIKAKFRTFYIDLKESSNGKFVKISEKSHGRKSTVMLDEEDVPMFIEALKEVQQHLS